MYVRSCLEGSSEFPRVTQEVSKTEIIKCGELSQLPNLTGNLISVTLKIDELKLQDLALRGLGIFGQFQAISDIILVGFTSLSAKRGCNTFATSPPISIITHAFSRTRCYQQCP